MKNIKITKNTQCCISIATSPGNFGSLLFNSTFSDLKLDFIYKPFKVTPNNLARAILAIRALNIRGCGVSMPHKTLVHKYLDAVSPTAKKIGAINTIVNNNGLLTGHNTDVIGVERALEESFPVKNKVAHVIGSGGVARAIIIALKNSHCKKITLSGRDDKKTKKIAKEFRIIYCPNKISEKIKADLLINATPVGMAPLNNKMIVSEQQINNYSAVMDVVVSPLHTKLIRTAKKLGKVAIPGFRMALYQASAQFTLYTEKEAPLNTMLKHMKSIIKNNYEK